MQIQFNLTLREPSPGEPSAMRLLLLALVGLCVVSLAGCGSTIVTRISSRNVLIAPHRSECAAGFADREALRHFAIGKS
jgi:hypothetical protein